MFIYSELISDEYLSMYLLTLGIFFYFFIFICGLILGSFLNSWMWRTRDNVRMISGRSQCVWCGRKLRWWENIPIISFVLLRGRCRTCHKPIPRHYPLVEFFTAVFLTVIFYYYVNLPLFSAWQFWRDIFFLTILIVVFVYDCLYQLILSRIIVVGTIIGGVVNYLFLGYSAVDMGIGAAIGGGFFLAQFLLSRGRWIGGGDVRMGIMMGVWLGWPVIIVALGFAYVLGAVVGLFLLALGRKKLSSALPFGAFLSFATLTAIYWGQTIVAWYAQFLPR